MIKLNITNLPYWDNRESVSGVYFFFDNDKLIYVGESQNISNRLRSHRMLIEYNHIQVRYYECDKTKRMKVERYFIRKLKPLLNIKHNPSVEYTIWNPDNLTTDELAYNHVIYGERITQKRVLSI